MWLRLLVMYLVAAAITIRIDGRVIGVDLGGRNTKVGSVVDRTFQVLLNEASQRRSATVVSVADGLTEVGSDGLRQLERSPSRTYAHFLELVGREREDPRVQAIWPYLSFRDSAVGPRLYDSGDSSPLSPEAMAALFLQTFLSSVSSANGQDVSRHPAAVTIPAHYGALERQALLNATKAAGMDVVALVPDGTAVAVHYMVNRRDLAYPQGDDPSNPERIVLFVDYGYSALKATLVSFDHTTGAKATSKPIPRLTVLATAYDETLSGRAIDRALAQVLKDEAVRQGAAEAPLSEEAVLQRLLAAAERAKETLSANAEVAVSVESLLPDWDLKMTLTRRQLEALLAPSLDDVLQRLLARVSAEMPVAAVEVVGGMSRIPFFGATLAERLAPLGIPLERHLDGSEAAVLGATFFAASRTSSMRVSPVEVRDRSAYALYARLEAMEEEDPVEDAIPLELFPAGSKIGMKRSLARRTLADDVRLQFYASEDASVRLSTCRLANFQHRKDFLKAESNPKVKFVAVLGPSGLPLVDRVETEWKIPVLSEKLEEEHGSEKKVEEETVEGRGSEEATEEEKDRTEREEEKEEEEEKKKTSALPTAVKSKLVSQVPECWGEGHGPSVDALADVVRRYVQRKEAVRQLGSARNGLEEFIYQLRDELDDHAEALASVSSPEELQAVHDTLAEVRAWFEDESDGQPASAFAEKRYELVAAYDRLASRREFLLEWPEIVAAGRRDWKAHSEKLERLWRPDLNASHPDVAAAVEKFETAAGFLRDLPDAFETIERFFAADDLRKDCPLPRSHVGSLLEKARLFLHRGERILLSVHSSKRFLVQDSAASVEDSAPKEEVADEEGYFPEEEDPSPTTGEDASSHDEL